MAPPGHLPGLNGHMPSRSLKPGQIPKQTPIQELPRHANLPDGGRESAVNPRRAPGGILADMQAMMTRNESHNSAIEEQSSALLLQQARNKDRVRALMSILKIATPHINALIRRPGIDADAMDQVSAIQQLMAATESLAGSLGIAFERVGVEPAGAQATWVKSGLLHLAAEWVSRQWAEEGGINLLEIESMAERVLEDIGTMSQTHLETLLEPLPYQDVSEEAALRLSAAKAVARIERAIGVQSTIFNWCGIGGQIRTLALTWLSDKTRRYYAALLPNDNPEDPLNTPRDARMMLLQAAYRDVASIIATTIEAHGKEVAERLAGKALGPDQLLELRRNPPAQIQPVAIELTVDEALERVISTIAIVYNDGRAMVNEPPAPSDQAVSPPQVEQPEQPEPAPAASTDPIEPEQAVDIDAVAPRKPFSDIL